MTQRPDTRQRLETFRREILRWNRQINLVTRQQTDDRLGALLDQCRDGVPVAERWLEEAPSPDPVWYFDLGSGGGLPGVVWHLLLSESRSVQTWLVEPRDKRAWFLERIAQSPQMSPFGVLQGRWGEVHPVFPPPPPGAVVVSLKALRLTDAEVLDGLRSFGGGALPRARVLIARYHPPEQGWSEELAADLEIPKPGTPTDGLVSIHGGVAKLGGGAGASLVISSYAPAG